MSSAASRAFDNPDIRHYLFAFLSPKDLVSCAVLRRIGCFEDAIRVLHNELDLTTALDLVIPAFSAGHVDVERNMLYRSCVRTIKCRMPSQLSYRAMEYLQELAKARWNQGNKELSAVMSGAFPNLVIYRETRTEHSMWHTRIYKLEHAADAVTVTLHQDLLERKATVDELGKRCGLDLHNLRRLNEQRKGGPGISIRDEDGYLLREFADVMLTPYVTNGHLASALELVKILSGAPTMHLATGGISMANLDPRETNQGEGNLVIRSHSTADFISAAHVAPTRPCLSWLGAELTTLSVRFYATASEWAIIGRDCPNLVRLDQHRDRTTTYRI